MSRKERSGEHLGRAGGSSAAPRRTAQRTGEKGRAGQRGWGRPECRAEWRRGEQQQLLAERRGEESGEASRDEEWREERVAQRRGEQSRGAQLRGGRRAEEDGGGRSRAEQRDRSRPESIAELSGGGGAAAAERREARREACRARAAGARAASASGAARGTSRESQVYSVRTESESMGNRSEGSENYDGRSSRSEGSESTKIGGAQQRPCRESGKDRVSPT